MARQDGHCESMDGRTVRVRARSRHTFVIVSDTGAERLSAKRTSGRGLRKPGGFPRLARYPFAVPTYQIRGDVPRKRHIQFRDNGRLLTEEVMGLEGFAGNESILYHLQSPCRVTDVADFEPIKRDEWVPDGHAHRHFRTMGLDAEGDAVTGRRLLMWNDDVEISLCRPDAEMD